MPRRHAASALLLGALLLTSSGCLTAEELRIRAESAPDPRQEKLDQLWDATLQVAQERAWTVDLARREDLLLTTTWEPLPEQQRRRVRVTALATPRGVALNAVVQRQTLRPPEGDNPEEPTWHDLPPDADSRREEEAIVTRIYTLWQAAW